MAPSRRAAAIGLVAILLASCGSHPPAPQSTPRGHTESAVDVAAGFGYACAATPEGHVLCWGRRAPGSADAYWEPHEVHELRGATRLWASSGRLCAIVPPRARCGVSRATPHPLGCEAPSHRVEFDWEELPELVNSHRLAVSDDAVCGLSAEGWSCVGALEGLQDAPGARDMIRGAVDVALGDRHICLALSSGAVRCWGVAIGAVLGSARHDVVSVPFPGTEFVGLDAISVTTTDDHACAITRSGGLRCWGINLNGEVGVMDTAATPGLVYPTPTVSVAAGVSHVSLAPSQTHVLVNGGGRAGVEHHAMMLRRGQLMRLDGMDGAFAMATGGCGLVCVVDAAGVVCRGRDLDGELGSSESFWHSRTMTRRIEVFVAGEARPE